jgi:holo-[acyl-carrier protein] synthase
MIVGIGTDLCDIRRIEAALARRGDRFAERVLGAGELQVFRSRRDRVAVRGLRFLATRFAAKEAFAKAIGLGIRWPMSWRACEILNEPGGKPVLRLSGELAQWFAQRQWVAHVTVTDEADYAAAFVVVERAGAAL